MSSMVVDEGAKADANKAKTKLKLPKFFNTIVAKMSPSKLTVDAVPVKKNGLLSASRGDINNENVENRIASIDPWQSVTSEEIEPSVRVTDLSTTSRQLMAVPSSLLISPNPNHLTTHALLNGSGGVAMHNIGVQNNFNLSHVTGVHFGNVNVHQVKTVTTSGISNSGPEPVAQPSTSSNKTMSKSIRDLLESTVPLDESGGLKMIRILARHMGANWKFTLRDLGFTDAEIDQKCAAYLNLKDGVYEIVYQSLLQWSRKQDDATIGQLCTFLWSNDQRDAVRELKNSLKKERARNVSESMSITTPTAATAAENGVEFEPSTKDNPSGDTEK